VGLRSTVLAAEKRGPRDQGQRHPQWNTHRFHRTQLPSHHVGQDSAWSGRHRNALFVERRSKQGQPPKDVHGLLIAAMIWDEGLATREGLGRG